MIRTHAIRSPSLATWGNIASFTALAAIAFWLLSLQGGGWWMAPPRVRDWWLAFACLSGYAVLCAWIWWKTKPRAIAGSASTANGDTMLVVHASQTGFAHEVAARTTSLLADAGTRVLMLPLGRLAPGMLANAQRILFIASTTGEGDPPDPAIPFVSDAMAATPDLSGLEYGLLALGDREYEHFCSFGHQLDRWLRACGATPLFDLTEVDNGDPSALRHWQHHVALLCNATAQPDWAPPRYDHWTLRQRRLLNPGSQGAPAYHLELQPPQRDTTWLAGDILEIGPCNAADAIDDALATLGMSGDTHVESDGNTTNLRAVLARASLEPIADLRGLSAQVIAERVPRLPHREYSIASIPAGGAAWLLVRQMARPDGTPGIGSGWLCQHAAEGAIISARVRSNPNFHAPAPERPMILIGNGTGIAGLRAHLVERIAAGARRNWLLFGERSERHDAFHREELDRWQSEGGIERMDLVFSRDGGRHRYVQDALLASSKVLCDWVGRGCAIYVCGSLHGMAPAVDAVLRQSLGKETVDAMLADGRYRRDVY